MKATEPPENARLTTELEAARQEVARTAKQFSSADATWSRELEKAFGENSKERRYDVDKSDHPLACRAAHHKREICRVIWEQASADYQRLEYLKWRKAQ